MPPPERIQSPTSSGGRKSPNASVGSFLTESYLEAGQASPPPIYNAVAASEALLSSDEDSELVLHIAALRRAMTADMEETVRRRARSATALDREARWHAIDFETLRDLRAAFNAEESVDGVVGITEDQFVTVFGGAMCGTVDEEVVRVWCRKLDSRCAGRLSWKDLSTYLIKCASTGEWTTKYSGAAHRFHSNESGVGSALQSNPSLTRSGSSSSFRRNGSGGPSMLMPDDDSETLSWQRELCDRRLEGKSFMWKAHNDGISKLLSLPHVNSILSASNDGSVRRWDHFTLEGSEKPLHVANEWVTGLAKVNGVNRIAILHADRSVFFYNIAPNVTKGVKTKEPVIEYYRGFTQQSVFVNAVPPVYQMMLNPSTTKRPVPGEPAQRPPFPVTLICPRKASSTALCHLTSTPVVETVLIGSSDGTVDHLGLRLGEHNDSVIPKTWSIHPHRSAVTQITYSPELQGIISSGGGDGQVIVTNLEHLVTTQSMLSDIDWKKAKPITQFEYSPSLHHLLVHGYGRNIFIWNALTGVRNHTITDLDHMVVSCALNPAKQRMYALTEGKVIRVYDIRTWKCLDSVSDDIQRVPVDRLQALLWHEATSLVVTGACNLVAWRTDEAQRAVEDNAGKVEGAVGGKNVVERKKAHQDAILQTHRLKCCFMHRGDDMMDSCDEVEERDQLVTVDATHVQVWSCTSNRRLVHWRWPHPSAIMCTAVDPDGRKLLVGADDGSVRWVSLATSATCIQLQHHKERLCEVSACLYDLTSPVPNTNLTIASIGRFILAWLYLCRSPVTPSSPKVLECWREIELPVAYGIVHSFCVSGPDHTCFLAATNSGKIVAFTSSLVLLYAFDPPEQIAAEFLHSVSQKLVCITYSSGLVQCVEVDCGKHVVRRSPFFGVARAGDCITALDSGLMECAAGVEGRSKSTHMIALGDSGGYLSIFESITAQGSERSTVNLMYSWKAHSVPITGILVRIDPHGNRKHSYGVDCTTTLNIVIITSAVDGKVLEWMLRVDKNGHGGESPPPLLWSPKVQPSPSNAALLTSSLSIRRRFRPSVAIVDEPILLSEDDEDDEPFLNGGTKGRSQRGSCEASPSLLLSPSSAAAAAAPATMATKSMSSRGERHFVSSPSRRSPSPMEGKSCTWQVVEYSLKSEFGVRFLVDACEGMDANAAVPTSTHRFYVGWKSSRASSSTQTSNDENNTSTSLLPAVGSMSKRFLSFSNLLVARDREILFEASTQQQGCSGRPPTTVAESPIKVASGGTPVRGSFRASSTPNSPDAMSLPPATPSSKGKFRTKYNTLPPLSSGSPLGGGSRGFAPFEEELKRPLSRVAALRRISGDEEHDKPDDDAGDDGGGNASPSVEKRLQELQRRREERDEEESLGGYRPYFGRLQLERFGSSKQQGSPKRKQQASPLSKLGR